MKTLAKIARGTGIIVGLFFGIPGVWLMATGQISYAAWTQLTAGLFLYVGLCWAVAATIDLE